MKAIVLVATLFCASCFPAVTLKPEYTAMDLTHQPQVSGQLVKAAPEVKVFYASSPAGFSLRDNELKVEPGYSHRILGVLKVRREGGVACSAVQAYANGANAVVYATTQLPKEQDNAVCMHVSEQGEFGAGWAVILSDAAPVSAAPVPVVPAPAPAATATPPAATATPPAATATPPAPAASK
jgi:hypothetical protein